MVSGMKKIKVKHLPPEGLVKDWDQLECEDYTLADFVEIPHSDIFEKARAVSAYVKDYFRKEYYTYCRILIGPAKNRVNIHDRWTNQLKKMIMMGSNNFLGLSYRPEGIAEGKKA